jgi:hypothetical protein
LNPNAHALTAGTLLWRTPSKLTATRRQITPTGIDNAHTLVVSLQRHVPRLGGRPPVFVSIVGRRINTPRVRQHGCLARRHQGNCNRACGNIIVTSCASRRRASCMRWNSTRGPWPMRRC